ncbi:MAG: hypothetical protein LBI28_13860 [Treponema sp.]|jgi:hypothetical protein|nr:hypothetical protein [Treponema sp.]
MKKVILIIFTLILAFPIGIAAQNRDYVPYVSQIRVEARNNLIRLTWVDSPDAYGPVYIFRSARPFSGTIPANIRPVVVRYGEQYYIDDTDDMENLYYFVAASDTSGQRYDIILPRINSTSLHPAQAQEEGSAVVEARPPTAQSSEPILGISNLRANQDGDRVVITFDTTGPRRNAILYRSRQPVRYPQDLLNAVMVQSGITSPFVDFPVPGISWFYTVIYEDEIFSGNMGVKPGINSTISAVTIYADQATERSLRPIPLPILTLRNTLPETFFLTEIPEQTPLSPSSESMLRDTQMPAKEPLPLKRPRVFAVDLVAPTGGEDSALFQIVSEHFVKFEWDAARISLQQYLSLPRTREIETRARFYLGQSLYYTRHYREALREFLSIRSVHLMEANAWIEAVLSAMVY